MIFKNIFKVLNKKEKVYGLLAVLSTLFSTICDLLNPFFFAKILEQINRLEQNNIYDVNKIDWWLFGVMIALSIGSLVFAGLYTYFSVNYSIGAITNLRLQLFKKIQALDSRSIDEITTGSLMTRITGDMTNAQTFLLQLFTIAIKSIGFILGGFILSFIQITSYINNGGNHEIWYITISYSLILVFFIVVAFVGRTAGPIMKTIRKNVDDNNLLMEENLNGNRIIRALNLEKFQFKKYDIGNNTLRRNSIKGETIFSIMMPFAFFIINAASLIILVFAGIYTKDNNKNPETFNLIGVIMSFIQYFMLIMVGLSLSGMFSMNAVRGIVSLKRIFKIFTQESSIKSGTEKLDIKKPINIEFHNVDFTYPNKNKTLENINFKISNSQWLGIIGQTGSGKSTLVNLISRLYDVDKGEILINGKNIKEYELDSLRSAIGVSLQEKVLIHGTIKSNIAIGKPDATDEEIYNAAKMAQALSFIEAKPDKFDSVVEQRGNNFSGGQKQRISIARALIKKPKILIFDDSTSALDVLTEQKILENLHKNFGQSIVIIVSQKIKSIQGCDQIIVLDDGKIIQSGNHKNLMKQKKGIYYQIAKSQNASIEE